MSAKICKLVALMSATIGILLMPIFTEANGFSERPSEFAGSPSKQRFQISLAQSNGISLVSYAQDIRRAIEAEELVRIQNTTTYYLDEDLGSGYPYRELMYYAHPWVKQLLDCFASQFYNEFGERVKVTSLIRTPYRQKQLQGWNPNAQQEIPSAHLTGSAVDISKKGMGEEELQWAREWLHERAVAKEIVVVEEMYVLNFHIFVVPTFSCHAEPRTPLRRSEARIGFPCVMH